MKIKSGYLVKEVAGTYVVVAVGKRASEFNGMINLNETAANLWERLEKGATEDELVKFLTDTYEVGEEKARENVKTFIDKLKTAGVIEGE